MGTIEFVSLVLASVIGLVLIGIWLRHQATFTNPTIYEVEDFVRAVDPPKLAELFDLATNQERWSNRTRYNVRRSHRVVVEKLRDYLLIMLGNAVFLGNWGKTDWSDMRKHNCQYSAETIGRIKDLIRTAAVFRKLARRALFIIWVWRLSRFEEWTSFPLPNIARLRKIAGVDILEAYDDLKRAAEALASSEENGELGKEIARYIRTRMLGPDEIGA